MTEQPQLGWIGWLWFDNSTDTTLAQKVQRAATRYAKKHGQRPTVCYVHPAALDGEVQLNGLAIVPAANVLVNHFCLGVMEGRTDA